MNRLLSKFAQIELVIKNFDNQFIQLASAHRVTMPSRDRILFRMQTQTIRPYPYTAVPYRWNRAHTKTHIHTHSNSHAHQTNTN